MVYTIRSIDRYTTDGQVMCNLYARDYIPADGMPGRANVNGSTYRRVAMSALPFGHREIGQSFTEDWQPLSNPVADSIWLTLVPILDAVGE